MRELEEAEEAVQDAGLIGEGRRVIPERRS